MSGIARRIAARPMRAPRAMFVPTRPLLASGTVNTEHQGSQAETEARSEDRQAVAKGARRDPELIVLFTIMCGVFGLAGWHFSRSPTNPNSEGSTSAIKGSEPWNADHEGKYLYYPGGDRKAQPKSAPSALNTVIVPNVNLPKELHDKYNKYGKDDY